MVSLVLGFGSPGSTSLSWALCCLSEENIMIAEGVGVKEEGR